MRLFPTLLSALILATALPAHEIEAGDLEIIHPSIPKPPGRGLTAGGYMAITNHGETPDRLIAVETPAAAKAELHISETDANGVATMRPLDGIDIAPGETAVLERGGMHVMLMGLAAPLEEGATVPVTLVFEHAGRVEVEFTVDPPGGTGEMHMNHGN